MGQFTVAKVLGLPQHCGKLIITPTGPNIFPLAKQTLPPSLCNQACNSQPAMKPLKYFQLEGIPYLYNNKNSYNVHFRL